MTLCATKSKLFLLASILNQHTWHYSAQNHSSQDKKEECRMKEQESPFQI